MIDVKDRVPSQVLLNGAIRYEEFDVEGNSLGYKYIKRADEPTEAGTPINKVLFDNLESYVKTIDRYTEPVLEESDTISEVSSENFFEYSKLASCTGKFDNLQNAFDVDDNSYAGNKSFSSETSIVIDTGKTIKNASINIKHTREDMTFTLSGSNDNTNWEVLLQPTKVTNDNIYNDSITLNDAEYRYFKLRYLRQSYAITSNHIKIYSVKVLTSTVKAQVLKIDTTIDSYDNLKLLNIKTPSTLSKYSKAYVKFRNLEAKLINVKLEPDRYYELIYKNDVYELLKNEKKYEAVRPIIGRMVPTSGWVADTDTADYKPTAYANNEWGKWRIAGISSSKTGVELVVDGDETTKMAVSSKSGAYFIITFPTQLLIAPEVLQIKYTAGTITSIQGKNEDGVWEQIKYTIVDSTDSKNTILTLPKYFTAIQVNLSNTSNAALYEFLIMQGHYKFKS